MELIPSLPKYLIISLLVSFSIYFTGHFILSFFRQDGPQSKKAFTKFLIGIIVWVISFASWYSSFNTILGGAGIVLLFSVFYYQKNGSISINNSYRNLKTVEWKFLLVFSILLTFSVTYFVNKFGFQLTRIHDDLVFYAGIADYIKLTKVETHSFNVINLSDVPTFYHYFDSWLVALLGSIFKGSSLNLLVYVVLPIYCNIIILGAIALAEIYFPGKKWFVYIVIGITFLFISTFEEFFNPLYKHFGFDNAVNRAFMHISNYKLAIVNICLLWFFINLKTNDLFKIFLPLCLVSILYPTTLPGLIGGSVIYLGFELLRKKNIKNAWWIIILILLPLMYLGSFYLLQNSHYEPVILKYSIVDTLKDNYSSMGAIINSLSVFLTFTIRVILSSVVYLFIYIIFYLKRLPQLKYNTGALILSATYIISLIFTCSIYYVQNSYQFNTNLLRPAFNICCYLVILTLIFDNRVILRYVGSLLILLNIIYHHPSKGRAETNLDLNNYVKLEKEFKSQNVTIAYIKAPDSYKTIFDKSINFSIPLPNIRRFSQYYFPICLSVFDIPKPITINEKYTIYSDLNESPFYAYVAENNLENEISKAQHDFLRLHTIDYVIVEKGSSFNKYLSSYNVIKRISMESEEFEILKLKWE